MSRIPSKSRNRTAPRNSSPIKDPKFLMIRQRINQIASSMRSPLKSVKYASTPEPSNKENILRTPKLTPRHEGNLEDFLISHNLENYVHLFKENQITFNDIPTLTKEDLVDMKLPIGPRKRLLGIIENFDNIKPEIPVAYENSPKRYGIKEEVDRFMTELSQFSRRSESRVRPSSRNISLEASFDSEINTQRICDNISGVIKDLSDKQSFMMKAIEENQKAIVAIRMQLSSGRKSKCTCEEYR